MAFKKHTALIDINAIGYACQQATRLTSGSMETQAAFGVIKTLGQVRQLYPQYTPLILWDGRAQWRYDLYPGYKNNRNSTPEKVEMKASYATQKPYIEQMLCHLGLRQMTAYTHEADDLAGYFARKLSVDPEHRIALITGDQDWIQMVRRNVFWRDLREGQRHVTDKNFYEFTGCRTPLEFLERKCLTGDTSDTITGVGGIGGKGAPEFIAEFGGVREFWRRCDAGEHKPRTKAELRLWKGESPFTKEEWEGQLDLASVAADDKVKAKMLKNHMDNWPGQARLLFRRNFQLMQLLKVAPPRKEDTKVVSGKFDKEAFANICEELSFISILKNLDAFTNNFIGNPT